MGGSLTGPARKAWLGARIVLAAACVSACAQGMPEPATSAATGPACFNIAMVRDYSPVDQDTLRFEVGPGEVYEVDFSGPQCGAIDWTHRIEVGASGASFLCAGNAAGQGDILFRDPLAAQATTCRIEAVRPVPAR